MTLSMNGGFDWALSERTNAVCDVNEQKTTNKDTVNLAADAHLGHFTRSTEITELIISGTNTRRSYEVLSTTTSHPEYSKSDLKSTNYLTLLVDYVSLYSSFKVCS